MVSSNTPSLSHQADRVWKWWECPPPPFKITHIIWTENTLITACSSMLGRFIYNCVPFFIFTFAVLPLWLLPAEGKHFKLWDMTMHNLKNFGIILKSAKLAHFLWFQIMTNMPPMANVPVMPNVRHHFFQRMPFFSYLFIYYVLVNNLSFHRCCHLTILLKIFPSKSQMWEKEQLYTQ